MVCSSIRPTAAAICFIISLLPRKRLRPEEDHKNDLTEPNLTLTFLSYTLWKLIVSHTEKMYINIELNPTPSIDVRMPL